MSIQTEIARIISDRNKLRNTGVDLGVALPTDSLSELAFKFESIENRGAVSATVQEGETFTVPEGYHSGSGTVSGVGGSGNYDLQHKTVTPTKTQQDITPDTGFFGLSSVTIEPIPQAYQDVSSVTATAPQVLANMLFVPSNGVLTPGTMPNHGAYSGSINGMTVVSVNVPEGYHNGSGAINLTSDIEDALSLI